MSEKILKMRFILTFGIVAIILAGCNIKAETRKYEWIMTKGDLLYIKRIYDGFEFAFATKENVVVDNITVKRNYVFKIDESAMEPTVYYEVGKITNGDQVTENHYIDSERKIELIMNREDYKKMVSNEIHQTDQTSSQFKS
ncbi:hypothetical protein [uncultured Brevibacillus sp.]|uniref:hypothetical protein n=1 Tax=uncultured Brevibacillus sp. TaxID=169970 RepID=UPI0025957A3C|nr:hypothetical protein [uncultured Brevibacillus sp.]